MVGAGLTGEHVATCTGYMEGALESGETVAARILEAEVVGK